MLILDKKLPKLMRYPFPFHMGVAHNSKQAILRRANHPQNFAKGIKLDSPQNRGVTKKLKELNPSQHRG
jgi:hypothetical protein